MTVSRHLTGTRHLALISRFPFDASRAVISLGYSDDCPWALVSTNRMSLSTGPFSTSRVPHHRHTHFSGKEAQRHTGSPLSCHSSSPSSSFFSSLLLQH